MIRARDPYFAGASDMSMRFASALLLAGLLLDGCSGSTGGAAFIIANPGLLEP